MTTLANITDRVQTLLADAAGATWPEADLKEWIIDGIRDYSIHFPRTIIYSATTVAGEREIELPEDFMAILQVQFPATDDPPHNYLLRMPRTHPTFYLYDQYYDVEPGNANPTTKAILYLSALPAGETIEITYSAFHVPMVTTYPPAAPISVSTYHEQIIEQYAVWQAHVQRLSHEVTSPDLTIGMIQQYKLAVQAAESSYRSTLRQALHARAASGWTGPWRVDGHDRIY